MNIILNRIFAKKNLKPNFPYAQHNGHLSLNTLMEEKNGY